MIKNLIVKEGEKMKRSQSIIIIDDFEDNKKDDTEVRRLLKAWFQKIKFESTK